MKAYERFLKYVSVWTTSDETSETVPSADRELVLAELLVEEMKELGIEDARVDEKGYVYGSVPATLAAFLAYFSIKTPGSLKKLPGVFYFTSFKLKSLYSKI